MPDDIDWFFNGQILTSDPVRGLTIKKDIAIMQRNISSILEIASVQMSDAGNYICRTSASQIGKVRVDVLNADSKNSKRGTERSSNQGRYGVVKSRHNRYGQDDDEEAGNKNGCSSLLLRPVTLSIVIFAVCLRNFLVDS
ncbi:protein CEPU-1 [Elysia marginata]|uniref:Protein CEPU-1 n=1 Tax=Elysia marginata TaxID=1093978 RepID=A0AAV4FM49_9GAST|nr:protein CEPU-1 [Elysia marginata]